MARILFIAAHRPGRSPSQRFRFEQYFSYLKENGFDYDFSYLISEEDDAIFYQPGNLHTKLYIFFKSAFKRWQDTGRAAPYDIVFIQREAFMTGSSFFEKRFQKTKAKLVFDFDDAIWHFDISEANKKFGWLKDPAKTARIISMSDLVIAGNKYLADYAKHHNSNVVVIPTTINTEEYQKPSKKSAGNPVCIGWSGSITTLKHFEQAIPILKKLQSKFGSRICFKVIGDENYSNAALGIRGIKWNLASEIEDLSEIDIGIMPLPNDEWAKGKCGLKGLQYMALEIPSIMSPVGVNTEIITDGVNGFLAGNENEWIEKISLLVENTELRAKMGAEARRTVEERYSVNSQKERYLAIFKNLK